jgi:hypothetical protein
MPARAGFAYSIRTLGYPTPPAVGRVVASGLDGSSGAVRQH